ncbi:MAG: dihydropteroate synthase [Clostridia bacterium]|nr:dihydropteroate synthase [Clostridia bacterium]
MQHFECRGKHYYNDKIYIMGILNVTPDSFSDGGRFFAVEDAVRQALQMQEEGANFIDIGAVSTRPGATFVTEQEEIARLLPVLQALQGKLKIPISVDTFRPAVAELALLNGADIINHVGDFSEDMAKVISKYRAGWIAVHTVGESANEIEYPDGVVSAVQLFIDEYYNKATALGVLPQQLMFDPGFGFSKNTAQNKELLDNLEKFDTHGSFLMTALSRKRFVGELTNVKESAERLQGTLLFDRIASEKGSCIVRVHDVKEHKEMFERI